MLPHASVAVQVLVTLYSLAHVPCVVTSACSSVVAPHASLDVGVENTGVNGHSIVAALPTPLITGAVLSSTVIVCLAVAVLPHASVAVHVLFTEYSLAHVPCVVTSACSSVVAPHASLDVGVENTGVNGHSIVAALPTPLITGAVLSSTVIVWLAVAVLPHASVAVHVLVTLYSLAHVP